MEDLVGSLETLVEVVDLLSDDRAADVAVLLVVLGIVDDICPVSSVSSAEWKVMSDGRPVKADKWMEILSNSVDG